MYFVIIVVILEYLKKDILYSYDISKNGVHGRSILGTKMVLKLTWTQHHNLICC